MAYAKGEAVKVKARGNGVAAKGITKGKIR